MTAIEPQEQTEAVKQAFLIAFSKHVTITRLTDKYFPDAGAQFNVTISFDGDTLLQKKAISLMDNFDEETASLLGNVLSQNILETMKQASRVMPVAAQIKKAFDNR